MTAAQRDKMYQDIQKHGENLKIVFALPADTDPVKLCKKLFSIEKKLNRVMCNLCNTNNVQGIEPHYETRNGERVWVQLETSEDDQEKLFQSFRNKIETVLGKNTVIGNAEYSLNGVYKNKGIVFFNHDPRGYSLKINEVTAKEYNIYTDMGGYGIIAPDFTPNN